MFMHPNNFTKERPSTQQNLNPYEKRTEDRRVTPAKGYLYISTVGWIGRREKIRRKGDPFKF